MQQLNIYICTTHKEEYKGSKSPFQLNSNNNCKLYRRRLNG